MSAAIKQYYLRATMGGYTGKQICYLNSMSEDGLLASFTADTKLAWSFNSFQREAFIKKYGHVTGRWVRIHKEQERIRAKKGAA